MRDLPYLRRRTLAEPARAAGRNGAQHAELRLHDGAEFAACPVRLRCATTSTVSSRACRSHSTEGEPSDERARNPRSPAKGGDAAARRLSCRASLALSGRCLGALFPAAARRGAGPLLPRQRVRPLLVGDPLRRHRQGRGQPQGVLFVVVVWRHHDPRPSGEPRIADVHRDGSAAPRRAAQGGAADRRARASGDAGSDDPRPCARNSRRPAARRNVRLGRSRVDRTDGADAGDAV